ncbi:hypothetical protein [Marinobacterium sedimentorum]|uniref:hypothetical protein n=1 Tax=Marinobacterium sedimentorum TaxID=2927804 RepID=UPI0020C63FDC|nr:hypothetical protein [Marinobacterium sedimentorum]MCP8686592.1 hypothetical protein [Marinobacterium sedimentorum]
MKLGRSGLIREGGTGWLTLAAALVTTASMLAVGPVRGSSVVEGLSASEEAALFAAAGFSLAGNGQYQRCREEPVTLSYQPGKAELADLNGDGQDEAWVTEGSLYCYGNTEQYFVLLTREQNGWRILVEAAGIPVIRETGNQGWPDIEVGGPGFAAFPLYRWNGEAYVRRNP